MAADDALQLALERLCSEPAPTNTSLSSTARRRSFHGMVIASTDQAAPPVSVSSAGATRPPRPMASYEPATFAYAFSTTLGQISL